MYQEGAKRVRRKSHSESQIGGGVRGAGSWVAREGERRERLFLRVCKEEELGPAGESGRSRKVGSLVSRRGKLDTVPGSLDSVARRAKTAREKKPGRSIRDDNLLWPPAGGRGWPASDPVR